MPTTIRAISTAGDQTAVQRQTILTARELLDPLDLWQLTDEAKLEEVVYATGSSHGDVVVTARMAVELLDRLSRAGFKLRVTKPRKLLEICSAGI